MKKIKFDFVYCIFALVGATLIALCNYSITENDPNRIVAGVGSLVCYAIPLVLLLATKHVDSGTNANLKVLSTIFFAIQLVSNFAFSFFGIVMPYYVVCDGLILLVNVFLWAKLSNITL